MNSQPTIRVDLTVGFGNNLFQFVYAKLLAEKIDAKLAVLPPYAGYFGLESLELLLDSVDTYEVTTSYNSPYVFNDGYPTITLSTEQEAHAHLQNPQKANYQLRGYFEDYTLYENDLEKIRSWFIKPPEKNEEDAILHLRLGDRLFFNATYTPEALLTFERYQNGLSKLDFNKLNIVSDLPVKAINANGKVTPEDLLNFEYHTTLVDDSEEMAKKGADYVNELIEKFSSAYTINLWNQGLDRDFQRIMHHDKVLFGYSTFAWWAATLSDASQVGVFELWRPWKEKNKNLGKTNYKGWFGWS